VISYGLSLGGYRVYIQYSVLQLWTPPVTLPLDMTFGLRFATGQPVSSETSGITCPVIECNIELRGGKKKYSTLSLQMFDLCSKSSGSYSWYDDVTDHLFLLNFVCHPEVLSNTNINIVSV
jgi:hypothetical protein